MWFSGLNDRGTYSQEEYDTHDPKGHCSMVLTFLRKRSKIIEIVAARDIIFALAQSGVCAAFSRGSHLGFLAFFTKTMDISSSFVIFGSFIGMQRQIKGSAF